jgi:hypothetical protein
LNPQSLVHGCKHCSDILIAPEHGDQMKARLPRPICYRLRNEAVEVRGNVCDRVTGLPDKG